MGVYKDRKNKQIENFPVKKFFGIVLLSLSAICLVSACFSQFFVAKFILGVFGLLAYPTFLALGLVGVALIMNMRYRADKKFTWLVLLTIISIMGLLHSIFSVKALSEMTFSQYISYCYAMPNGVTVGGVIIGLIADLISCLVGGVGTCVFFGICICVFGGLTVDYSIYSKENKRLTSGSKYGASYDEYEEDEEEYIKVPASNVELENLDEAEDNEQNEIVADEENSDEDETKQSARSVLFGTEQEAEEETPEETQSARDILFGEKPVPNIYESTNEERRAWLQSNTNQAEDDEDVSPRTRASNVLFGARQDDASEDEVDHDEAMNILGIRRGRGVEEDGDDAIENSASRRGSERGLFATDLTSNETDDISQPFGRGAERNRRWRGEQTEIGQATKQKEVKKFLLDVKYNPPPTNILKLSKDDPSKYNKNYEENARRIEDKLETFKLSCKVTNVVRGPTVTRYELSMPSGVPVKKILAYNDDLAMALMSKHGVRIEAPIPGKDAVGVEVPNDPRSTVSFRELVESPEFQSSTKPLPVAIGKNITGEVIVKSLAKLVHVLVAGSTGSGKSVFLHSLIVSLMFKMSPQQLRFILIDPKRVEFSRYKGMPHMMLPDVVSDAQKAVNSLTWAVKEMQRRYQMFEETRTNNIETFNQCDAVKNGDYKKIPYIVIVVDELAELMMAAKKEVEEQIRRLSQLARACGIHLVLATQRPSVEVVTGTIKANLPSRIAFALTNYVDSKTILDEPGAENLLGMGDMLFSPQDMPTPVRLQAAYISDDEVEKCIKYIRENNECDYDEEVEKEIYATKEEPEDAGDASAVNIEQPVDHSNTMDPYLPAALKFFIESKKGSVNMIQRRFYVGYSRAARIVDQMELRGYVSPANGSKNREVLITMDEFIDIFGDKV
ncbi:MAG: DUF87 domain-containing protein [Clostridia bacterium]|nr:DUF87 domain-containing protein [Clostridia bacterium]